MPPRRPRARAKRNPPNDSRTLIRPRTILRWPALLSGLLLAALLIGSVTRAELTEEEKKELFLKSRERMRTIATPTPEASATPRRKPKPAQHPPAKKKKAAKPKATPEPEEKPARTPRPKEEEEPERRATPNEFSPPPAVAATPAPTPAPSAVPKESSEPAQVVIQKSGYKKPRGFSLLPFHLFGKHYKYLTRSVRSEIDRAPVLRERWKFIIVHNSGTRQGNARIFDYYHRHVRRMHNGLAYHFVIGNGTSSGNGEIEVGGRWRRQINGGHVHSDYLNNISLGICLVGDFNRDQPTRAQLDSCEELIRYLRARCGKVDRHEIPVRPHREMNPPRWPTDCPGDDFPYRWFGQFR
ncbi:MAG TPA: peptidoglycan recognition family protein [Chthoniobacterales bacterium]|nr:peptidoglycan recognition family protein [Chthoniobacterales bacterium]